MGTFRRKIRTTNDVVVHIHEVEIEFLQRGSSEALGIGSTHGETVVHVPPHIHGGDHRGIISCIVRVPQTCSTHSLASVLQLRVSEFAPPPSTSGIFLAFLLHLKHPLCRAILPILFYFISL